MPNQIPDDQLVLVMPDVGGPRAKLTLEEMHRRLAADPHDADAAAVIAGALVADGRALADPRLFGRAEAVLSPWWTDDAAPLAILRLRASIRDALGSGATDAASRAARDADYAAILAAAPGDPDALLAFGRQGDCDALAAAGDAVRSAICAANLAATRGDHTAVLATLAPHVDPMVTFEPALKGRALSLAADAAAATGDLAAAEQYLQHATLYLPHDRAKAKAYGDFLAAHGRASEAPSPLPAPLPASAATLDVTSGASGPTLKLALDLRDVAALLPLDANKDGGVTWGELKTEEAAVEKYVSRRLAVHDGPRPCALGDAALSLAGERLVLDYALACPTPSPQNLAFTYDLVFALDARHSASLQGGAAIFTRDKRDQVLVLREPSTAESFVGIAQLSLALAVTFLAWIFFMRERRSPRPAAGSATAGAPPPTSPSPQPR